MAIRLLWMVFVAWMGTTARAATVQGPSEAPLIAPGESVTVAFTVLGEGSAERIDPVVSLPDGWRLLVPENAFGVAGDGRVVRLLTLASPQRAAAGVATVTYSVGSSQADASITVQAQPSVLIDVRQLPEVVARGETLELEIGIYNAGNVEVAPALLLDGSRGVLPAADVMVDPLQPGDTRVIPVTLQTRNQGSAVDLRIVAEEDGERIGRVTTTVLTAVAQQDDWATRVPIPGGVSAGAWMRAVDDDVTLAPIVQATLEGHLDEDKQHHVDALLRGPDAVGVTSVGYLRDEYRAAYAFEGDGRSITLDVGDTRHAFSDLLLRTGRQRGISAMADVGRFQLGGVAVRDRFVAVPRTLAGVRGAAELTDDALLGVSAMYTERQGDAGLLLAQNGEFSVGSQRQQLTTAYEVAWGDGLAASARVRARLDRLGLSLIARRSGSDFLGEWAGQTAVFGSSTLQVGRNTRLAVGGNYLNDRGDSRLAVQRIQQVLGLNGQISHKLSKSSRIALRWRRRDAESTTPSPLERRLDIGSLTFDTRGRLGQLGIGTTTRLENDATYGRGTAQQFTVRAGSPIARPVSVDARAGYILLLQGQGFTREQFRASLGLRANIADTLAASARYNLTAFPSDGTQPVHYARTQVAWTVPWRHTVSVWADVLSAIGPFRITGMATYTVPFTLRGGRRGDQGSVFGDVVHADGTGVPGAQVRFGDYLTETDEAGRFVFTGLPPRTESLRLMESTLPAGEMVSSASVLGVEPKRVRDQVDPIRFEVSQAGGMEADVEAYELLNPLEVRLGTAPAEYRPVEPVVGATLTLTRGDDVLSAVSNTSGRVSVDRAPAGRWVARLSLPRGSGDLRVEQPRFIVDIEADRMASYTLRALPDTAQVNLLVDSPVTLSIVGDGEVAPVQADAPATLTEVQVRPETLLLDAGQSGNLRATAVLSDEAIRPITTKAIWRSDNPRVARVDDAGRIEAIAPGNAGVTAAFEGVTSNRAQVEVIDVPIVGLSLDAAEVLLSPSQTRQLTAQAVYVDGRIRDATRNVRWVTTDPNVAMVDANGLVRATGVGTAQVSAEFTGVRAFPATVVVGDVTAITLSAPETTLRTGRTVRPVVKATLASGGERDVTTVVAWRVADPTVVQAIGSSLTAVAPGRTSVTALFDGRPSNTLQFEVQGPIGLVLSPDLRAIPADQSIRLSADAIYPDGDSQPVSRPEWRGSDDTVATISSDGILVARQAGQLTLSVQADGASAERVVRVVDGARTLRANVAEQRVEPGETQLRVIANYADGTEVDVTPWVQRWSSSQPDVGRVNTRGIVTITAEGTTVITATLDDQFVTFTLINRG